MSANYLEQLVAEWYEFQGYYVRRNVRVGKLKKGGYLGELDVVAFHPIGRKGKGHLVHIEASMDASSWKARQMRFRKKFRAGQRYVPEIFPLANDSQIEFIALLGARSTGTLKTVGVARIVRLGELLRDIRAKVEKLPPNKDAIPEQFIILRTLQYASHYWA